MKPDPPRRADGRCARLGCRRPLTFAIRKDIAREQYEADPFCSTECCKAYHGVVMVSSSHSAARTGGAR